MDGNEAWLQLEQQRTESGDPEYKPKIEGSITAVVKDLSPSGLTNVFELNFRITETQEEEAKEEIVDDAEASTKEEDDVEETSTESTDEVDFEAQAAFFAQKLRESAKEKKKALSD